ncbi:MAG: galactokinase [Gordonia polyisoprenivorans]|nr:galactokinase [Gordonia polyisoprenivorans]
MTPEIATTVRAYAPGRVNLIGEHTDYNLGYALPIALRSGTSVTFTADDGDVLAVTSEAESQDLTVAVDTAPGDLDGWGAYVAGCVWALQQSGHVVRGGRMSITSTVPMGSGLSSSAALECAVLLALTAERPLPPLEVARIAQRAENDYVGAPTGLLDQLSSLYGRADTALLVDFSSLEVTEVPMDLGDAHRLLVIDSHAPHQNVAGEYAKRRLSCENAARELGVPSLREVDPEAWRRLRDEPERSRARHILTENTRVFDAAEALRHGDLATLGRLMCLSHASMRDDFEITTEHIDLIAERACELGALGARMTGGGFGGSVIALCSDEVAHRITAELGETVADAGYPAPTIRAVRPGRGAHLC